MSLSKNIMIIMNSIIKATEMVTNRKISIVNKELIKSPLINSDLSVLVGVTGDVRGQLIIKGDTKTFTTIGENMYGMQLEGEMLHSFVGEFGNMLCGNTATILSGKSQVIDITPPTVLEGEYKLFGFEIALSVTLSIENIGNIIYVLSFRDDV